MLWNIILGRFMDDLWPIVLDRTWMRPITFATRRVACMQTHRPCLRLETPLGLRDIRPSLSYKAVWRRMPTMCVKRLIGRARLLVCQLYINTYKRNLAIFARCRDCWSRAQIHSYSSIVRMESKFAVRLLFATIEWHLNAFDFIVMKVRTLYQFLTDIHCLKFCFWKVFDILLLPFISSEWDMLINFAPSTNSPNDTRDNKYSAQSTMFIWGTNTNWREKSDAIPFTSTRATTTTQTIVISWRQFSVHRIISHL